MVQLQIEVPKPMAKRIGKAASEGPLTVAFSQSGEELASTTVDFRPADISDER